MKSTASSAGPAPSSCHSCNSCNSWLQFYLHYGDIGSSGNLSDIIRDVGPEEIYHLAAQSHVRVSFDLPDYTGDVTGLSAVRILEAMCRAKSQARFYQASAQFVSFVKFVVAMFWGSTAPPERDNRLSAPNSCHS